MTAAAVCFLSLAAFAHGFRTTSGAARAPGTLRRNVVGKLRRDVVVCAAPLGSLTLVGAGPGDPELLTVAARAAYTGSRRRRPIGRGGKSRDAIGGGPNRPSFTLVKLKLRGRGAAAAVARLLDASATRFLPRSTIFSAATRLRGLSASQPRRRRDPSSEAPRRHRSRRSAPSRTRTRSSSRTASSRPKSATSSAASCAWRASSRAARRRRSARSILGAARAWRRAAASCASKSATRSSSGGAARRCSNYERH